MHSALTSNAPGRRRGSPVPAGDSALRAYERCAAYYDVLTADYDHEAWLSTVLGLAETHGFQGDSAIDVACGTGKSAEPLVRRGFTVTACDLSPAMARRARLRLGGRASVFVSDMRQLPVDRSYDLLTCLDDALNYLLSDEDLHAALASFASVLEPGGFAVFDTNTASTYREVFGTGCDFDLAGGRLRWRGQGEAADGSCAAIVEPVEGSGQTGRTSLHIQRRHPPELIAELCAAVGLQVVQVAGQSSGCVLHDRIDEEAQSKLLYVVRRRRGVTRMIIKP